MQAFEYIVALVSILLGLALADIASSLHRLLRARGRVRWDWHAPLAAVILVLLVLDVWWGMRQLERAGTTMTIGLFLPLLCALFTFFLLAAAALPDEVPADGLDLRAYYFEQRRYFWTLFALFVALAMFHVGLMSYQLIAETPRVLTRLALNLVPNFVIVLLAVSLAMVGRAWWHTVGLGLLLAAQLSSHMTRALI